MSTDHSILAYELFQGDRDSDVTIFSNKMVVTRKPHKCVICFDDIPVGTRVRAQSERDNDDKVAMTFYVCLACCEACAAALSDDPEKWELIENRYSVGAERAHNQDVLA